jgi:hypothetical protein
LSKRSHQTKLAGNGDRFLASGTFANWQVSVCAIGFFLQSHRLDFVAVEIKLLTHDFFYGDDGIVKLSSWLTSGIGSNNVSNDIATVEQCINRVSTYRRNRSGYIASVEGYIGNVRRCSAID